MAFGIETELVGSVLKRVVDYGVEAVGAADHLFETSLQVAEAINEPAVGVDTALTEPLEGGTPTAPETIEESAPSTEGEVCLDTQVIESEITVEPGCTGVIQALEEWAENAVQSDATSDTYPEGSIPDRLVEAALSGDATKEATRVTIEQGLYRPGDAKDSFNLWADSKIRMSEVGGLEIVNPNGSSAYTLWNDCDQGPYMGNRMIPSGPCVGPVCQPDLELAPLPEPEAPPDTFIEEPAPETVPEIVYDDSGIRWTDLWYQGELAYECAADGATEMVMMDAYGLSDEELTAKAEDVARSLRPDYQADVSRGDRVILIRVFSADGTPEGNLRCFNLDTGTISDFDSSAGRSSIQALSADEAWDYFRGSDHVNDESSYDKGPALKHPHEPTMLAMTEQGTLETVPRSMENLVWLQTQLVGESVFGREWMLSGNNQELWNRILGLSLPQELFGDLSADAQVELLRDYVERELGYRMTQDEGERMVIWMDEYAREADTPFLRFNTDIVDGKPRSGAGYVDPRRTATFGEFFKVAAEEAARRGELGPVLRS